MSDTNAIIATYATHQQVEAAIRELERAGVPMQRLSIIGKGYHSEEHPVGFYTLGDRIKSWGGLGAFWGALWGMLLGAAFFWVPGVGPLGVAGPFVHILVGGAEGAAVVGGASVLGAALVSLGVPKDSVIKYESSLRADKFLLIVHASGEEVARAREVIDNTETVDTAAYTA